MNFLNYCQLIFPDKFKSNEVILCYDENTFSSQKENINAQTLCIIIFPLQDYKITKKSLSLKTYFSYIRFYSDSQNLFAIGLNNPDNIYIPDYISDHKLTLIHNRKTIVIYVFHIINENVKFFIQHGLFESPDIQFIIVCNGNTKFEVPHFVRYINRENIGYDFGAWSYAIFNSDLIQNYDFFVLINSSVRGPFIPPWSSDKNWVHIFTRLLDYQTKLIGTTLGIDEYLPHIQSAVLITDKIGLNIGIEEKIFEKHIIQRDKRSIIIQKEIGLSQMIMKHGYKIRTILSSYYNTDIPLTSTIRSKVHHINQWYFGTNLHPYEIIFIKDNHNINFNRDIKLLTTNHNLNFNQSISPSIPTDFVWTQYLKLNPDIGAPFNNEIMAVKHWLNFGFYENRKYQ